MSKLKRLLDILLSYVATPLPVGMEEFETWTSSILTLSKVPDNDSTRFAVATMIFQLRPDEDKKPKRYFIRALNKGAASECANAIATSLRDKRKAEMANEAQKKSEATGLSNGSTSIGNSHDNLEQV